MTNLTTERAPPLLRKSRSGCRDCKLRKVKCDEMKPVCSNCRRRYAKIQHCDWGVEATNSNRGSKKRLAVRQPSERPPVHSTGRSTIGKSILGLISCSCSAGDQGPWRRVELRLMHHYTAVVSSSMPDGNGAPARDMWQKIIPQLAFDSELVLNPMLALSALHLHAHSPNDPIMVISLRRYLDRTIMNHRHALSHPRHEISEQLWLSAVILANMYWLLAHERRPAETYALPFQAWTMIRGISILYSQNKALLNRLGYSWFEHAWLGYEIQPLIAAGDKLSVASMAQLQSVKEDLEHLLIQFRVAAQVQGNKEVYLEAKNYVLYYYRAFYSGAAAETLRQFIATMAVRCQPGYTAMLERHDPLAMALMSRMLVLLCGLEPAWWINGRGDYEVLKRDIQGICELMPAESHWVMDWPCAVLNGEIILNRLP